nr:MAG TPA: hypothetical protein [Bacteriophage sp.]
MFLLFSKYFLLRILILFKLYYRFCGFTILN